MPIVQSFTSGSGTFTVPAGVTSIDVLVVGGGGAGGSNTLNNSGGGGGAGDVETATLSVTPGDGLAWAVGAGGVAAAGQGAVGSNSSFGTVTAKGGGGGGTRNVASGVGSAGGSGGGASTIYSGTVSGGGRMNGGYPPMTTIAFQSRTKTTRAPTTTAPRSWKTKPVVQLRTCS